MAVEIERRADPSVTEHLRNNFGMHSLRPSHSLSPSFYLFFSLLPPLEDRVLFGDERLDRCSMIFRHTCVNVVGRFEVHAVVDVTG